MSNECLCYEKMSEQESNRGNSVCSMLLSLLQRMTRKIFHDSFTWNSISEALQFMHSYHSRWKYCCCWCLQQYHVGLHHHNKWKYTCGSSNCNNYAGIECSHSRLSVFFPSLPSFCCFLFFSTSHRHMLHRSNSFWILSITTLPMSNYGISEKKSFTDTIFKF